MATIRIDGSLLEGGGQIVRLAMSLSALMGKPITVENIRGKRSKPGLKAQHQAGIRLISDLTNGHLIGNELHSSTVEFRPGSQPRGGVNGQAETGTAGATTLLAQISLPCLVLASPSSHPSCLRLRGGTNADMAPQVEYMTSVFLPNLHRFGADFQCEVKRKGFFPKGGGEILLTVPSMGSERTLNSINVLDFGEITEICVSASVAGSLPVKVGDEMVNGAVMTLKGQLGATKVDPFLTVRSLKEDTRKAFGNGSSVIIVAKTSTGCVLGGSSVGSPKKAPFATGREAALDVIPAIMAKACVDKWMQDQLIVYMALAKGHSKLRTVPLTLHTKTAIFVSELMTGAKFCVSEEENHDNDHEHSRTVVIECDGVGYVS